MIILNQFTPTSNLTEFYRTNSYIVLKLKFPNYLTLRVFPQQGICPELPDNPSNDKFVNFPINLGL